MSQTSYSPSPDMVEMNRIHYELEYTEGINQRMRIPERLKVASGATEDRPVPLHEVPLPTSMMHVPERIVVAGESGDSLYSRPRDLDLIQSTPVESVALMAPPRVLTLTDQPLDFLERDPSSAAQPREEAPSHTRSRRERCVSETAVIRHHGPPIKHEAMSPSSAPPVRLCPPLVTPEDGQNLYSASGILTYIQCTTRRAYQQVLEVLDDSQHRVGHPAYDLNLESTPEETSLVDAASLRRQIVKLNRRLHLLEQENKERTRREMIMYSVTVAFWLVNTWVWFRR
ncbi:mitochondrial fission factor homolog A isoform X2 [Clupea harengus]|nr:mitochondrial fission factor homolog A isoform X2 [Clupea harengus]XP_042558952.1 mitochondrial fission factor homolog A isoform X2 [Clupea harengus]XP_042558953.1 mitochondrial fission factor homolog A isoform X2 [Clupea harengus]